MSEAHDEQVELLGRRFTLRFGPLADFSRVEVNILQGWSEDTRPYVRTPVRGRNETEARERALEVLEKYAGLDRYVALVAALVREQAPGATLMVEETAADVRIDIGGPWRLRIPLSLVREDALDPDRTEEELTAFIRSHLDAYLWRTA